MVYCLCRGDDTGEMVSCDRCKEWFHFRCVNISDEEDLGEKWYCPLCSQLRTLEESILKKCECNINTKFAIYDDRLKKLIDENRNLNGSVSDLVSENVLLKEKGADFDQHEAKMKKLAEDNRSLDAVNKELEHMLSKASSENVLLNERCEKLGVDCVQYETKLEKLSEENRILNASTKELECKLSEVSSKNASLKRKSAELIKENKVLKFQCEQLQQNLKQAKENPGPSSSQFSNITSVSQKKRSLSLSGSQKVVKMSLKKKKENIDDSD